MYRDDVWAPLQPKLYCPNVCRRQPAKKIVFFCNLAKLKLPLLMIPNGNLKWQKTCSFWALWQPNLNPCKCLPAPAGKKNCFLQLDKAETDSFIDTLWQLEVAKPGLFLVTVAA